MNLNKKKSHSSPSHAELHGLSPHPCYRYFEWALKLKNTSRIDFFILQINANKTKQNKKKLFETSRKHLKKLLMDHIYFAKNIVLLLLSQHIEECNCI